MKGETHRCEVICPGSHGKEWSWDLSPHLSDSKAHGCNHCVHPLSQCLRDVCNILRGLPSFSILSDNLTFQQLCIFSHLTKLLFILSLPPWEVLTLKWYYYFILQTRNNDVRTSITFHDQICSLTCIGTTFSTCLPISEELYLLLFKAHTIVGFCILFSVHTLSKVTVTYDLRKPSPCFCFQWLDLVATFGSAVFYNNIFSVLCSPMFFSYLIGSPFHVLVGSSSSANLLPGSHLHLYNFPR